MIFNLLLLTAQCRVAPRTKVLSTKVSETAKNRIIHRYNIIISRKKSLIKKQNEASRILRDLAVIRTSSDNENEVRECYIREIYLAAFSNFLHIVYDLYFQMLERYPGDKKIILLLDYIDALCHINPYILSDAIPINVESGIILWKKLGEKYPKYTHLSNKIIEKIKSIEKKQEIKMILHEYRKRNYVSTMIMINNFKEKYGISLNKLEKIYQECSKKIL